MEKKIEEIKKSVIKIVDKKQSVDENFSPVLEVKILINPDSVTDCLALGIDVGKIISEEILNIK